MIDKLDFLPDISFVPYSLEQMIDSMIAAYEEEHLKLSGKAQKVEISSPEHVMLQTQAYRLYQVYEQIDFCAKQNFIKYATGNYLENLGAMVMVKRLQPQSAVARVRFELSAAVDETITIPKGVRVSTGDSIFFETDSVCYVEAGATFADAIVSCTVTGTVGNNYKVGSINILADPVRYVTKAVNTEASQGGADLEDDDNLRMRIYLKPDSFSVAGPNEAYRYFAFEYSQNIVDCNVASPVPGEVVVVIMLKDGEIPTSAFLSGLFESLGDCRPLTDKLVVAAPEIVNYDLAAEYFISNSYKNQAEKIKANADLAVSEYIQWQKAKLGRDINPNELIRKLLDVGVKRVNITSPIYQPIEYNNVAIAADVSVGFGGFENE